MRLATAQHVLGAMGVPVGTGSTANAETALDVTSRLVENMLETELERATWTDFFDYEIDLRRRSFQPAVFRLSSMFLDQTASVVVRESYDALKGITEGSTVSADDYVVDYRNGRLVLLRDTYPGYYTMSVTYVAGFSAVSGVLTGLPDWLVQAGTVAAQHYLSLNPAHIPGKKITAVKEISSGLRERVSVLVNPHLRERALMSWPARTVRHD